MPPAGSASMSRPFSRDGVDRAHPGQVDRLDRGHDADPGPADPGEVGDLALDVHAHLEDGRLVLRTEPQDGQWEPDLVVLVALVLERPEAGREDRRDRLLGRGLGDAPGDPDGQRVGRPGEGRGGGSRSGKSRGGGAGAGRASREEKAGGGRGDAGSGGGARDPGAGGGAISGPAEPSLAERGGDGGGGSVKAASVP